MLDWFTTIPGILIICGVILLVIAIILFVAGAKKSKKEGASTVNTMDNPVEATSSIGSVTDPVSISPVESVENVNPVTNDVVSNAEVSSVVEEPVHIEEPEVVSTPVEEVSNSEPVIDMPAMETPVEVPEVSEPEAVTSTVYGGEMPRVDFSVNEEKPVTIYGGNDPLEATQTLPKMEEHHVPYGGEYPEARIVEPVVEQPVPTPVEETVSEISFEQPEPISITDNDVVTAPTEIPEPVSNFSASVEDTQVPVAEPISIVEPEVTDIPTEVSIPTEEVVTEPVEEKETTVEEL